MSIYYTHMSSTTEKFLNEFSNFKYYASIYDEEMKSLYKSFWSDSYIEYRGYYGEDIGQMKRLRDKSFRKVVKSHFNQVDYEQFKQFYKKLWKAQHQKTSSGFIDAYFNGVVSTGDEPISPKVSQLVCHCESLSVFPTLE